MTRAQDGSRCKFLGLQCELRCKWVAVSMGHGGRGGKGKRRKRRESAKMERIEMETGTCLWQARTKS